MATTVGVLTILAGPARQETERLWRLFETEYDSRGVQAFAHPHLTFHAGTCLDVAELDDALSELCQELHPFDVIIDGLGYFDAPSPVIFMKVEPTDELRALHRRIGEFMGFHCVGMYENYLPPKWVPHVTLAMTDLTPANFERAWRDLQECGHSIRSGFPIFNWFGATMTRDWWRLWRAIDVGSESPARGDEMGRLACGG